MTNNTKRSKRSTFFDCMTHPIVRGSIMGSGVMFWVTPGLNIVTSMSTNAPMPWSQPFTGWQPLVVSGVVGYATSFAVKNLLGDPEGKKTSISATAGAISGIAICPFECVNVNHQGRAGSTVNTARVMFKHHGYTGFFHGTTMMMARESAWFTTLMAVPRISQNLQESGYNKAAADAFSLIVTACLFGFISTPINRLRIMKQSGMTTDGNPPSYKQLAVNLFQEHPDKNVLEKVTRSVFKGAGARSATAAVAGTLFYYGSEQYDRIVSENRCTP